MSVTEGCARLRLTISVSSSLAGDTMEESTDSTRRSRVSGVLGAAGVSVTTSVFSVAAAVEAAEAATAGVFPDIVPKPVVMPGVDVFDTSASAVCTS